METIERAYEIEASIERNSLFHPRFTGPTASVPDRHQFQHLDERYQPISTRSILSRDGAGSVCGLRSAR